MNLTMTPIESSGVDRHARRQILQMETDMLHLESMDTEHPGILVVPQLFW